TFTLTDPSGMVVDTEAVTVAGNGTYPTPTGFLPSAAGTYQWVASYSGDDNNDAVASGLGDEAAQAWPATPRTPARARPTVAEGGGVRLTDSATLAGGFNPTGTITFTLFAPGGGPVDMETVTVNGNGTYPTPTGFVPTMAGIYHWMASYSGDDNNVAVASDLGDEPEQVDPATPTITTLAGPTVVVGSGAVLTEDPNSAGGGKATGADGRRLPEQKRQRG